MSRRPLLNTVAATLLANTLGSLSGTVQAHDHRPPGEGELHASGDVPSVSGYRQLSREVRRSTRYRSRIDLGYSYAAGPAASATRRAAPASRIVSAVAGSGIVASDSALSSWNPLGREPPTLIDFM